MSIGDLSRLTGVKVTTIRWYEGEGWLPAPARTEGGHRVYGDTHLRRLGFFRHSREIGFSMNSIRSLLDLADRPGDDCSTAHAIAVAQIAQVDARLRRLEALRGELERMATSCVGGHVGDCRIIETWADFGHGHCGSPSHGYGGTLPVEGQPVRRRHMLGRDDKLTQEPFCVAEYSPAEREQQGGVATSRRQDTLVTSGRR